MDYSPVSLVAILGAAVLAPLCAEAMRRFKVPAVLFELALGIVLGPYLLGWVEIDGFIDGLSQFGLSFLMFFAGYEIDFTRVRGAALKLAGYGWLLSMVVGLVVAFPLMAVGFIRSDLLVGLALTTTAIGTLLPMMKDQGITKTRFGTFLLAAGSAGEFGPIIAVTLLLSSDQPIHEAVLLVAFVVVALGAASVAVRPQPPAVIAIVRRHIETSSQLPVRIAMLLLGVMLLLAYEMGLDTLLGAFVAGVLLRLLLARNRVEQLQPKLEAVGYGVFIPIFFVVSGVNFDLEGLISSPSTMARVPMFLAMFLVVRGLPAMLLYRKVLEPVERRALAVLSASALPLVVVITTIGLETNDMSEANATALVSAGMLSVLVYPLIGFALARRAGVGTVEPGTEPGIEPGAEAV